MLFVALVLRSTAEESGLKTARNSPSVVVRRAKVGIVVMNHVGVEVSASKSLVGRVLRGGRSEE
jgi:hypothetical protein